MKTHPFPDVPYIAQQIGRDEKTLYRSTKAAAKLIVEMVAANPVMVIPWVFSLIQEGIRLGVRSYMRQAAVEQMNEIAPELFPRPTLRDIDWSKVKEEPEI